MKGKDILKSFIGKKLESGRIQSFFLNGKLVSRVNLTYLKFDKWIRIVVTDGTTNIGLENEYHQLLEFQGDKEYEYPVDEILNYFPEFEKYYGNKLLAFKELVHNKNYEDSYGINLCFENNLNFIIYDHAYSIDENEFFFENKIPEDIIEK